MDKARKKHIWIVLYVLLMIAFVAYLFLANRLIVSLDDSLLKLEEISEQEYRDSIGVTGEENVRATGSEIYLSLEDPSIADDDLDKLTLSGFAAIKTSEDNANKYTDLLLIGEQHFYKIRATQQWSGEKEGYGGKANIFLAEFPTLTIKNDVYKLGVYVWENETCSGFMDTGYIFEKHNGSISEYVPGMTELYVADEVDDIMVQIEENSESLSNGYYWIKGLAASKDKDSAKSNVYLNLLQEDGIVRTFGTELYVNPYFNDHQDSDQYTYCRFKAKIPEMLVKGQKVRLQALVENNGIQTNQSESYYFDFTDNGHERVLAERLTDFEPAIDTSIPASASSTYNLTVNASDLYYKFNGMAWAEKSYATDPNIYLRFEFDDGETSFYQADVGKSRYLANIYGEETCNGTYNVQISKDAFAERDVNMDVLVEVGGYIYQTDEPFRFVWQNDAYVLK